MNTQPSITLRATPADADPCTTLLDLRVLPAQRAWVGMIADALADLARCPDSVSMTILRDDIVVGHYRIDPHPRSVAGHDFAVPTLGLRAFFIDARWQGQGLGRAALRAMLQDLPVRYPAARQLVLNVNTDNRVALRLYLGAGFADSGELYDGGHPGAQQLLLRPLP
ncbi:MAG: GNAT family N-acetyltransferase [Rhodanobacter sp.]